MAAALAAVLGTGQTKHTSKRTDVSMAGLCREAIDRALADAQVGWDEVDAVVLGKAPDLFEGDQVDQNAFEPVRSSRRRSPPFSYTPTHFHGHILD